MSRLQQLFKEKNSKVLNIYCTAGYPKLGSTLTILNTLVKSGVDIVELGMPYSDPLADGSVIQASSSVAIENGTTIAVLFEQLQNFRIAVEEGGIGEKLPIILMGYMNPVLQFGFKEFCKKASEVGVDALILPDLPEYEFETEYGEIIKQYGLDFIFLVTPETLEERVKHLDRLSTGFLYAVSSSSTTGNKQDFDLVDAYLQRLQSYNLKNPVLVGFGISNKETFNKACSHSNGAIIGSAFIKALENTVDEVETTKAFVASII